MNTLYDTDEQCNKKDCNNSAVLVMKIYTDEAPVIIGFCPTHILEASRLIDSIIHDMIQDK